MWSYRFLILMNLECWLFHYIHFSIEGNVKDMMFSIMKYYDGGFYKPLF